MQKWSGRIYYLALMGPVAGHIWEASARENTMKEGTKDALKAGGSAVGGGAVGAAIYSVIGGIGIAGGGTAVGITLGPFIAIGSGIGLAGYGLYWLGKQVDDKKK